MATSGDILLAIREDFYMATDTWIGGRHRPGSENAPCLLKQLPRLAHRQQGCSSWGSTELPRPAVGERYRRQAPARGRYAVTSETARHGPVHVG